MFMVMPSLMRIEKEFNTNTLRETAKLLDMTLTTFQDNRRRAKLEYDISIENDPIKKEELQNTLLGKKVGKKEYANPIMDKLVSFGLKENLNLNWVFYGNLPMYKNDDVSVGKIVQQHNLKEYLSDDVMSIPYFSNIKASAGNGYNNDEDHEPDFIILPKGMVKGSKLNALKVDGDSMSPNIKPNSIIFIDLSKKKLKKACVYVVRYEDEVYVKRLEQLNDHILLRSDNIAYSTITAKTEEVFIIGQVINSIATSHID